MVLAQVFQQQLIGPFSLTSHPKHFQRPLVMTAECLAPPLCLVVVGRTHASKAFSSPDGFPWMDCRHIPFSWAWLVVSLLLLMVSAETWCPFLTVQKSCWQIPPRTYCVPPLRDRAWVTTPSSQRPTYQSLETQRMPLAFDPGSWRPLAKGICSLHPDWKLQHTPNITDAS